MTVSIRDVAARAGVGLGTVSNVLNHADTVAPATREKVMRAIADLGYVRNEAARHLRAGQSNSIGFVALDMANPFFADVARGIATAASGHGLHLLLTDSQEDPVREAQAIEMFGQQRVRGLIVAPTGDVTGQLGLLRAQGLRAVLVDRVEPDWNMCSTSVDDLVGGRLAAAHLIDKGHRRIAFVGGPASMHQVRERFAGASQVCDEAGVQLERIDTPGLVFQSGIGVAEEIAARPAKRRPSAVFAVNDLLAIGLLQGFTTHQIAVPGEIAIVGYDDIVFARAAAVPLSSIRQPRKQIGKVALEQLWTEFEDADAGRRHEHAHVSFKPELVARASS